MSKVGLPDLPCGYEPRNTAKTHFKHALNLLLQAYSFKTL